MKSADLFHLSRPPYVRKLLQDDLGLWDNFTRLVFNFADLTSATAMREIKATFLKKKAGCLNSLACKNVNVRYPDDIMAGGLGVLIDLAEVQQS